ncbi:BadF/BadG/BcrA/BcrD ATPase family protein [Georgenia yuyongxinii]
MTRTVLVAADVGGTSSTVAVLGDGARVIARVDGPGGNFRTSPGSSLDTLGAVLAAARAQVQGVLGAPWHIAAMTVGVAGAGAAGRSQVDQLVHAALRSSAIPVPRLLAVDTDLALAYAAAAPGPDGALLLAGTGAVACRLRGFTVEARCDGLGWLLGDVGSGVWIGLAGLRAAAAALDGRGPRTALSARAVEWSQRHAPSTGDPRQDLVRLVGDLAPAELGGFARVVTRCADDGDPVAIRIADQAADELVRTLDAVAPAEGGQAVAAACGADVVLAGSVLTRGRVGAAVRARLAGQGRTVHVAGEPVVGGLRLAAARAGWAPLDLAAVADELAAISSTGGA